MEFKIGEVSKMTGLSSSGIRFYEKEGILSPSNGRKGTYRSFGLSDVSALLDCRNYRQCGFSLDETANLLKQVDPKESAGIIEEFESNLLSEIIMKQKIHQFLQEKKRTVLSLCEERIITIENRPEFVRFDLWQPNINEDKEIFLPSEEIGIRIPFADSNLLFQIQDIESGKKRIETKWGLAIDARYLESLKWLNEKGVSYYPAVKSIHRIIKVNDDLSIDVEELLGMLEYAREHHLMIKDDIMTQRVLSLKGDTGFQRYDHCWIEIVEK